MRHVALLGKARAGKDTAAKILVEHAGFTRLGFADKLKEAALRADPIIFVDSRTLISHRISDVVRAHGWEKAKDRFPEVRRFLQEYGQTMREVDPKIWIRPVRTQVMNGTAWGMPAVVADVRYENEVDMMREQGAVIVRVEREGAGLKGEAANHRSETELDRVTPDVVLGNHGTLQDLYDLVKLDLWPLVNGD